MVIVAIILWVAFAYIVSTTFAGCENTIIQTVESLNKKHKAVLFERSCGATTGFSSQVSILRIDEDLGNNGGNIYRAKGYPNNIALKWTSKNMLFVGGASFDAFKKRYQYNEIDIVYE